MSFHYEQACQARARPSLPPTLSRSARLEILFHFHAGCAAALCRSRHACMMSQITYMYTRHGLWTLNCVALFPNYFARQHMHIKFTGREYVSQKASRELYWLATLSNRSCLRMHIRAHLKGITRPLFSCFGAAFPKNNQTDNDIRQ